MRKLLKGLQVLLTGSVKAIMLEQLVDAKFLCSLGVQLLALKHYWGGFHSVTPRQPRGLGTVGKMPHGFPLKANPGNVLSQFLSLSVCVCWGDGSTLTSETI